MISNVSVALQPVSTKNEVSVSVLQKVFKWLIYIERHTTGFLKLSVQQTNFMFCGKTNFNCSYSCFFSSLVTVEFADHPTGAVFKEGDQVTLNCNATGIPLPQIAWKKGGELVMNSIKHTVTIYPISSRRYTASQLQIRQVSKEDVAVYSCIAWNRGSIRVWQTTVLLTGKFHFTYFVFESEE